MISRNVIDYEPRYQRFILNSKDFGQQFSHLYSRRIDQMRAQLSSSIHADWISKDSSLKLLDKIIDSETCLDQDCILIGTIYKEMQYKPSVLDEFKERNGISGPVQSLRNFTSDDDCIILEDDSGRAKLQGMDGLIGDLVTGVTLAISGRVESDGLFHVKQWKFAGDNLDLSTEALSLSATNNGIGNSKNHIMLVSGLELGSVETSLTAIQLLIDFVAGRLGGSNEKDLSKSIGRIIVAGNVMAEGPKALIGSERYMNPAATKKIIADTELQQAAIANKADVILAQLAGLCPLDLMPGTTDPANYTLPQQPIHPCLLPHSARFNTMGFASNPYEARCGQRIVMGHSGQPVDDMTLQIRSYNTTDKENGENKNDMDVDNTNEENNDKENGGTITSTSSSSPSSSTISLLKKTLEWAHLAPTAPDSLSCYPYLQEDPFVLESLPDILFSGGQLTYETELVTNNKGNKTRLVCVPSFKKTRQVVLVNLDTLDTQCISFKH